MVRARLFGILVTYRRHQELARYLAILQLQDRPLDQLVVVDNEGSSEVADAIARYDDHDHPASYVAAHENLGPAGGIALGMRQVLQMAEDHDWLLLLDDDDPPDRPSILSELSAFADQMVGADRWTAGVGLVGARFDWRRGRLNRVSDSQLTGAVSVDYIGGNHFPFYLASAVRSVGPFAADLFFGFDDLEYGLRLGAAGYHLYASGPLFFERRRRTGRLGMDVRPTVGLDRAGWRRYYSLRNTIRILRLYRRDAAAARVAVVRGIGKPIANLPRSPRLAWRHLRLGARACRDGWTGRMGRTIEPDGYDVLEVSHDT